MRLIFCFFCGGEGTKWERVVSAEKGSNEDCNRRWEGMFGYVGKKKIIAWFESLPEIIM